MNHIFVTQSLNNCFHPELNVPANVSHANISNLTPHSSYVFSVKGKTRNGQTGFVSKINHQTLEAGEKDYRILFHNTQLFLSEHTNNNMGLRVICSLNKFESCLKLFQG